MNAATRGVVLAVVALVIGFVILNGIDGTVDSVGAGDSGSSSDDGSTTDDDNGTVDDGSADDGSTDDGTSSDDGASTDGDDSNGDDGAAEQPTGVVEELPDEPTDATLHPAAEVRVLVANGTNVAGAAGDYKDNLVASAGYNGLPAANATNQGQVTATLVHYEEGYGVDARQIASTIGAAAENVLPMPESPPVADLADAHVLIVLGTDVVGG